MTYWANIYYDKISEQYSMGLYHDTPEEAESIAKRVVDLRDYSTIYAYRIKIKFKNKIND